MSFLLEHVKGTIAVSGLRTGDNPQPGVPVIRSIRNAGFKGKIIGFIYDSLESGIYAEGLVDKVYQMPYPSEGAETFMDRMDYILSQDKIDVIIPTLDSEIITYIRLKKELTKRGVHTFLPEEEQFILRDKTKLSTFFPPKGISVPKTILMNSPRQAKEISKEIEFPVIVKGRFYEAFVAQNPEEVVHFYHMIEHKWGLPVLVQEIIVGDEFNVVIIGDGKGHTIGMVPQRKLVITDKGKGFGGVVVKNPKLDAFSKKIIDILHWQGPCELEIMKDDKDEFFLLEINPRFPAWVRLAEGAGQNLPAVAVALALGEEVQPFNKYESGTLFIRHAEDLISNISVMGEISTKGELTK
jgi:carbamoyl-phosphate synthase large subunit